jgi:MFS family permease
MNSTQGDQWTPQPPKAVGAASEKTRMPPGFACLMLAQFLSALADHAALWLGVRLLQDAGAPAWQLFLPKVSLIAFYVLLAPLAGPLSDRFMKNRVMFAANALKLAGAISLLIEPSFLAFIAIGIGVALYAPAKFGLVTDLVAPAQLVRANSWIEVSTVGAVVLGTVTGGFLSGADFTALARAGVPFLFDVGISPSLLVLVLLYLASAVANGWVPNAGSDPSTRVSMSRFVVANRLLWRDPLARIALTITILFWTIAAGMQVLSLSWFRQRLAFDLDQIAYLQAACELAIVVGAFAAGHVVKLERALRVLPLAYVFGLCVLALPLFHGLLPIGLSMVLLGLVSGFLVVPMNALLQHRGRQLLSSGESIAIQNFNECLGIILTLILLSAATGQGVSPVWMMIAMGSAVLGLSFLVQRHIYSAVMQPGDSIPHHLLFKRA